MLVEPVLMYRHSGVYEPGRYFGAGSGELGEGGDGDEDVRASIAGSSVVLVSTTEALAADDADVRSGCFSLLAAKVRAQEDARKVRAVLTRVQLALDGFHAPNDTDATAEGSPRPLSRMPLATRRGSSAARESADVLAADVQVGALASMLRASLCACVGTSVCMHACTRTGRYADESVSHPHADVCMQVGSLVALLRAQREEIEALRGQVAGAAQRRQHDAAAELPQDGAAPMAEASAGLRGAVDKGALSLRPLSAAQSVAALCGCGSAVVSARGGPCSRQTCVHVYVHSFYMSMYTCICIFMCHVYAHVCVNECIYEGMYAYAYAYAYTYIHPYVSTHTRTGAHKHTLYIGVDPVLTGPTCDTCKANDHEADGYSMDCDDAAGHGRGGGGSQAAGRARWARELIQHSTLQGHLMIDVCEEMMVRLRAVLALVRLVGDARKHTHAQHKRTRTQTHIHTQVRSLAAAMEMLDYALRCLCVHSHPGHLEACEDGGGVADAAHASGTACDCRCWSPRARHGHFPCSSTYKVLNEAEGWWWTGGEHLYNVYC